MSEHSSVHCLRVILSENIESENFSWFAFDAQQKLIDKGKTPISGFPAHELMQWIVPASVLAGYLMTVPEDAGSRLQTSIIEQRLEDELLESPQNAHVVYGTLFPAGREIWVCRKKWLSDTLTHWALAGFHPQAAYPEYDLLPKAEGIVCAQTVDSILCRLPSGQTVSFDDLETACAVLKANLEPVFGLHEDVLPKNAVNLLCGEFASSSAIKDLSQFKPVVKLALISVVIFCLSSVIYWQKLEWQERNLRAQIRQSFAAAFPGTPIVDPILQWESKRRERNLNQNAEDALDFLVRFAQEQSATGIEPQSIEFRDGLIRMVLTENDWSKLRNRLQQNNQKFSTQPAEPGFSRIDIPVKPE